MTLQELLFALTNTPGFYECGSRAVAKRIGSDHVTAESLYQAVVHDLQKAQIKSPGESFKRLDPLYWIGRKPIIITEQTDYDFYCQYSQRNAELLEKVGFVLSCSSTTTPDYCDDLCHSVYEHEQYDVQVVLRTDALLYKAIFDNIPYEIYHDYLWKSSPTAPNREHIKIWFNTFARLAKAAQELT